MIEYLLGCSTAAARTTSQFIWQSVLLYKKKLASSVVSLDELSQSSGKNQGKPTSGPRNHEEQIDSGLGDQIVHRPSEQPGQSTVPADIDKHDSHAGFNPLRPRSTQY